MQETNRTEISTIGEFGLIKRLTEHIQIQNPETKYGVGDDAAVLDFGQFLRECGRKMKGDILNATTTVCGFRVERPLMRHFRRDQHHFSFPEGFADAAQGTDAPASDDIIQLISGLAVAANLLVGGDPDVVEGVHIANIR